MNYADLISELLELPARIAIREDAGAATKLNLEAAQSGLLLSGEITGKNAEERKAQLFLRTEELERNAAARIVELHELQNRFAALRSVARLLAPQDDRE